MLSTEGSNRGTNMAPAGSEANDYSKEETPLIQGLPDDVAILCLARVPRTYHANLKCVSKRWKKLVCGEQWRIIRKKYNLEETWIYAFCQNLYGKGGLPEYFCYVLDPYASRKRWKCIQDLPPCIVQRQSMEFEVLGQKVYLIGGHDFTESEWSDDDSDDYIPDIADEVHCYDGITNSWSKVAPMSTPRSNFASGVLDVKIYAVGSEGKHTWEAYDPVTNVWKANSDPRVMDWSTESIVYNGKLYVRKASYSNFELFEASRTVYDPSTGIWHDVDDEMLSGWHGTSVVVDGRLFALDVIRDYKFRTWEEDKKIWIPLVDLSSVLDTPGGPPTRYQLVGIGKSIFFIGEGLFTVELDVRIVGEGGVLPLFDVTGATVVVAGGNRRFSKHSAFEYPLTKPLICKGMTF